MRDFLLRLPRKKMGPENRTKQDHKKPFKNQKNWKLFTDNKITSTITNVTNLALSNKIECNDIIWLRRYQNEIPQQNQNRIGPMIRKCFAGVRSPVCGVRSTREALDLRELGGLHHAVGIGGP